MCTKEEVNDIVAKSEERIVALVHDEIAKLRDEVKTDREFSHRALSNTISDLGSEFLKAVDSLKEWRKEYESEVKEWRKEVEVSLKNTTHGMNTDINELKQWRSAHEVDTTYIKERIDTVLSVGRWILTVVVGAVIVSLLNLVII